MGKREACDPTLVKMAEEEPVSSEATGGGRGRGGGEGFGCQYDSVLNTFIDLQKRIMTFGWKLSQRKPHRRIALPERGPDQNTPYISKKNIFLNTKWHHPPLSA